MVLVRILAMLAALLTLQAAERPRSVVHAPNRDFGFSLLADHSSLVKKIADSHSAPPSGLFLAQRATVAPQLELRCHRVVNANRQSVEPRFGYRFIYSGLSPPFSIA